MQARTWPVCWRARRLCATTPLLILCLDTSAGALGTVTASGPHGAAGRVVLGPGAEATGSQEAAPAPAEGAAATPPVEDRAAGLLQLKFKRLPAAVLEAMVRAAPEVPPDSPQMFGLHVLRGDWLRVGEFLAGMETTQASKAYDHLLAQLGQPPAAEADQSSRARGAKPPEPVLLPGEVLALADIAPGELGERQIAALGKVLKLALASGSFVDGLVRRLEAGSKRLGGTDQSRRLLAAELLFAAGRPIEAGAFLPDLEQTISGKQHRAMGLHAKRLVALVKAPKQDVGDAERHAGHAWDVVTAIMAGEETKASDRRRAAGTVLDLLERVDSDVADQWLRSVFEEQDGWGLLFLAELGKRTAQRFAAKVAGGRQRELRLQQRVVEQVLSARQIGQDSWRKALNILALGWLREAEHSAAHGGSTSGRVQYVPYGPYGEMRAIRPSQPGFPVVPADKLLAAAPGEKWLSLLDDSLRPRIRMVIAKLHMGAGNEEVAAKAIDDLAQAHPSTARDLAHEFLRAWSRSHNPNTGQQPRRYPPGYYPSSGQRGAGIPLARAIQVRNIEQLAGLLARWRELPFGEIDHAQVVGAFAAAHSDAEVFRREDIEAVFGAIGGIPAETLAGLVDNMRVRLSRSWARPEVQEKSGTKRKDKDIQAEVNRGYGLAMELLDTGLTREPDNWRLLTAQGALFFGWGEFSYGKHEDLAAYTEKRERAFDAFARAAAAYATKVAELGQEGATIAVYDQWFGCALGIGDLPALAREQQPRAQRVDRIREAILALPGEAAQTHLAMFGEALSQRARGVPEHLKVRYLRWGLKLVGDHESVRAVRDLVANYDALLKEILLDVRVDGDARVGQAPFGVVVGIRHTTAVDREAGGFRKYLQNRMRQRSFYPYGGGKRLDYRDALEENIRTAFAEGFDIKSITFHTDKVEPRGIGRPGWRVTPLAYVVLQATDASRDRLPAVKMDIDFVDRTGSVVLPIASQVQLIDARGEEAVPREARDVTVTQVVDGRNIDRGEIALEVRANGKGLIPPIGTVLDLRFAGFTVNSVEDHGLSVTGLDAEGDPLGPLTERSWIVAMTPAPGVGDQPVFRFPRVTLPGVKEVVHKRYAGADLEGAPAELTLGRPAPGPGGPGWWWGAAAALVGCAWLAWRLIARRRPASGPSPEALWLPEPLTPFSALLLLRDLLGEGSAVPATRRAELAADVRDIEDRAFGPRSADEAVSHAHLEEVTRRWLRAAQG